MRWRRESPLLRLVADSVDLSTMRRRESTSEGSGWSFATTPEFVVEAWVEAQRAEARTSARDVLVTDDEGSVALFALSQAMRPAAVRRDIVVLAGKSRLLEYLWIAGTLDGLDYADEILIDWEITLYRFATRVITASHTAATLLRRFGIRDDVEVIDIAQPGNATDSRLAPTKVWLSEPQSRRAQTAMILRALADTLSNVSVVVSSRAEPDGIWAGTTMDANSRLFEILGPRVSLARRTPRGISLILLGDPFALPDPDVSLLRNSGVPVAVPAGSTAASYWPESPTWSTEEDIIDIVDGRLPSTRDVAAGLSIIEALQIENAKTESERARRVSVGVPVFRDVRFLDECVESILGQSQPPCELLLIDDGSQSPEVDDKLNGWARKHSGLIRVIRQPNRGVCVARNSMLDTMTGDAFLLVDADDVLDSTFIEKTATALRANPGLDAVATWTEFFGKYCGVEAKPPFDARVGRRENPIVSTCVLVDMAVRDRGIRFAPDLAFIYCEDWDFWAQIAATGGKFGLVPEPLARHRVHKASGGHRRTELAHRIGKARATARLQGL